MNVMPAMLNASIVITGGSGAVASSSGTTIKSVVRNSIGNYTITFQDPYASVLAAHASMISPVSGLSGILGIEIGNAPSTSIQVITGGSIVVKTLDAAGALANPAAGSTINVVVIANNSKVPTS